MRRKIIAGNWKMNGDQASVARLVAGLVDQAQANQKVDWIICPSYIFIPQVTELLKSSNVSLGAQNLCAEPKGAYTGEVSAAMLKDFACQWVIVGHSERRAYYGEDDSVVAKKFALAREFSLKPVLCVGETLNEREQGLTQTVVSRQLDAILNLMARGESLADAIIAYEPVWAIGTGKTATPDQAQAVHQSIRQQVAKHNETIANRIPILYGGSVNATNAAELFAMPDIDGGLIGGASLIVEDFIAIGQAAISG